MVLGNGIATYELRILCSLAVVLGNGVATYELRRICSLAVGLGNAVATYEFSDFKRLIFKPSTLPPNLWRNIPTMLN